MTSKNRILQLVKASNPLAAALTVDDLVFGVPEVLVNEEKNTELTLTAASQTGLTGSVTIRYDRHELSELGDPANFVFEETITLAVILARLNEVWQTEITTADLEAVSIPSFPATEIHRVTLTAAETSLEWIGEITINVVRTANEQSKADAVLEIVTELQEEFIELEAVIGQGVSRFFQVSKINATSEAFIFGQAVYAVNGSNIVLAKADADNTSTVIGLVAADGIAANGGEGKIQSTGLLTGTVGQWEAATGVLGGLVPNKTYFLDPFVRGRITPFGLNIIEGHFLTAVGTALSPTQLSIDIDRPVAL